MIKRMNKLAALLVASTAVASLVPTTAANAATKLETLNGTIENAQAFDGGKYVFDGYKEDQDAGLYYSNGTKDTEITDVDGAGLKYGDQYLNYKDSDDEVLFNLINGQADDDTAEDKQTYMETKFKSAVVKKADRYDNSQALTAGTQLNEDQFGDVWYEYKLKSDDQSKDYTVYINQDGKYVDASETLNITYYKADGTKVQMDDVEDIPDGITVTEGTTLFADADYIYRSIKVTEGSTDTYFLQRVSKAQGDTKDGAYLPKSVISYEVGTAADLAAITPDTNVAVRVSNSALYVINTATANEITIDKYDLKKDKVDSTFSTGTKKVDKYIVDKDEDYDNIQGEDMKDFDIDVDGNVWVIYKGDIQKVVDGKLQTMYTADTSMDNLSVYDDNDIVAWGSDNDIYSVVAGEDKTETETPVEETPQTPAVTAGWVKNTDGTWSYNKADGTKSTGWVQDGAWYFLNANGIMQTGWVQDGATWYFLNASGAMQTGWVQSGSTWYYLNASGAMQTGWLNDNGTWYYLNASGAMAANTTVDGYKLGANGAWIK